MAALKCKMCGAELQILNDYSITECEYCGSKQTLPKMDNDRKVSIFDRANFHRSRKEFDKASALYENILIEEPDEAEAYWGICLCRYGIEYVVDPSTQKRIPTCHRAQYTSVLEDKDYLSAINNADLLAKEIYQQEAEYIDKVQKSILEISSKEEPFDIFICYKETDEQGNRTIDSVVAQEIYDDLTEAGYKVFFARITLEDKLGSAYEPYIFAALNSSKVMLVVGSKIEHFNAVWVKNEWSRFLSLIAQGNKKTIIPCYRDISPYELPEELTALQSQDVSKVGWKQDLIRGISKILGTESVSKSTESHQTKNTSATIESLLTRAYMFLEDRDWTSAESYCEKILDIEPENVSAYLAKLLAELRISKKENLAKCTSPFDYLNSYKKIIRFADEQLKQELVKYNSDAKQRQKSQNDYHKYSEANSAMQRAETEQDFLGAARLFDNISYYKDSKDKADTCRKNADKSRKNAIYQKAEKILSTATTENDFRTAKELFKTISGWRDAEDKAASCQKNINVIRNKAKAKRIFKFSCALAVFAVIAGILFYIFYAIPLGKYNTAVEMIENGQYDEAYQILINLEGFKNSNGIIQESKYSRAKSHIEENDKVSAYKLLKQIKDYKDSEDLISKLTSEDNQLIYKGAEEGDPVVFGHYEQDNDTSNGKEEIEWIVVENENNQLLLVSKYCLDCKPYNKTQGNAVWASSFLRSWLNNDFYNSAFSSEEKTRIPSVLLKNSDEEYGPSSDTNDKVFSLSYSERWVSLSSENHLAKPTAYAIANGVWVDDENGNSTWWLRNTGITEGTAFAIYSNGDVSTGLATENTEAAVRPAIWLKYN